MKNTLFFFHGETGLIKKSKIQKEWATSILTLTQYKIIMRKLN
jgi:hypothetical protein